MLRHRPAENRRPFNRSNPDLISMLLFLHPDLIKPDSPLRLRGFYRPQPDVTGFAIPVFGDGEDFYVEHLNQDGLVDGYLACDVTQDELIPNSDSMEALPESTH